MNNRQITNIYSWLAEVNHKNEVFNLIQALARRLIIWKSRTTSINLNRNPRSRTSLVISFTKDLKLISGLSKVVA